MKKVVLSETAVDALLIAAHTVMNDRLPAEDYLALEEAEDALVHASDVPDHPGTLLRLAS